MVVAIENPDSTYSVTFSYQAAEGLSVMVAGSFSDWAQMPMERDEDGFYRTTLRMKREYHEYRFVVDGKWVSDDTNPIFAANDFGTLNSVLDLVNGQSL